MLEALEHWGVARRAFTSVMAALGVALVPKCPLCVAAYLASVGVSVSAAAAVAPWLRPIVLALSLRALISLAVADGAYGRAAAEAAPSVG